MITKRIQVIAATILLALLFTGCVPNRKTIYQADWITVERAGRTTYITADGSTRTFTRVRRRAGEVRQATTTDVGNITYTTAFNVIIVTNKASGTTLYIRG